MKYSDARPLIKSGDILGWTHKAGWFRLNVRPNFPRPDSARVNSRYAILIGNVTEFSGVIPDRNYIEIGKFCRPMPRPGSVILPIFINHIGNVVKLASKHKMFGVDASGVVAFVENAKIITKLSVMIGIRSPVSEPSLPVMEDSPIPTFVQCPRPLYAP